ncbi:integrase, partial [Streptomyces mirabilis]
MLLRLAYLAATNTLALLRLLPMSDRDKDIEILALRHQLLVLQRQARKPVFTETDRAILAGLLHQLPKDKLRHFLLLVRPDTRNGLTTGDRAPGVVPRQAPDRPLRGRPDRSGGGHP